MNGLSGRCALRFAAEVTKLEAAPSPNLPVLEGLVVLLPSSPSLATRTRAQSTAMFLPGVRGVTAARPEVVVFKPPLDL